MCHVTQGWGGVGFGGVITLTYLRTPMMLRHGTFTCTCAHTWCYVEDVSRHAGVGWGNNVHVLAHSHDVTPRHVHLHVRTYVMLRWRCVTSRRGGVGWGNSVGVLAHSHDVTPWQVHLHVRTYVMLRWRCVTSRRGGVGWGGVITSTYLPVFPISWHLAQKTKRNWMTSCGRTFAHGSGDGRQM